MYESIKFSVCGSTTSYMSRNLPAIEKKKLHHASRTDRDRERMRNRERLERDREGERERRRRKREIDRKIEIEIDRFAQR